MGHPQAAGPGPAVARENLSPAVPWVLQTEYAHYENGHYSYRIHRSPLCEYMINFIHKLKHLPEKYMMNSVLENFTILQVWVRGWAPRGGAEGPAEGTPSSGALTLTFPLTHRWSPTETHRRLCCALHMSSRCQPANTGLNTTSTGW